MGRQGEIEISAHTHREGWQRCSGHVPHNLRRPALHSCLRLQHARPLRQLLADPLGVHEHGRNNGEQGARNVRAPARIRAHHDRLRSAPVLCRRHGGKGGAPELLDALTRGAQNPVDAEVAGLRAPGRGRHGSTAGHGDHHFTGARRCALGRAEHGHARKELPKTGGGLRLNLVAVGKLRSAACKWGSGTAAFARPPRPSSGRGTGNGSFGSRRH